MTNEHLITYILNKIIARFLLCHQAALRVRTHRASASASASRSIGMHCDAGKWRGDRFPSITIDPMYSI